MTDSDLNRDDLNRDDLNRDDLNRDRTWLITGAGRGIGRALTETVGAVGTMPTMGLYASKWALEGFSEALAGEVAEFGVRVTIAELGGFGTDWAGSSMHFATPTPTYRRLREKLYGTAEVPWPQVGEPDDSAASPIVAAAAIRAHVEAPGGPLRLLVGDDAPAMVAAALTVRRDDYLRDPRFSWPEPPGATAG